MKKLPIIFALLCLPFAALAALPIALAIIPAAQIGMKIMPFVIAGAAGVGVTATANYYQATGQNPVYQALGDASQAANDYLYQPAKLAWQQQLVTPSSFPTPEDVFLGTNTHVGAKISDLADYVRSTASGFYPNIKSILAANTSTPPFLPTSNPPIGTIVSTATGQKLKITGGWNTRSMSYRIDSYDGYMVGLGYLAISGWKGAYWRPSNPKMLFSMSDEYSQTYQGHVYHWVYTCAVDAVIDGEALSPPPLPLNYPGIKSALQNNPASVASEVPDVLKNMPVDQVKPVGQTIPTHAPTAADAPSITNSQLSNFYKTNYGDVATHNTTNITSTSTVQDIAKGQAAVEAAKAAVPDINIPDKVTYTGSANLPDANQYDPNFTQPEEINFVNKVHGFINSGLPVLSAIRSSGISASGSPVMNTTIWGNPVVIDFSGQQTPLRAAGSVLVIISLILAYLIVVRS